MRKHKKWLRGGGEQDMSVGFIVHAAVLQLDHITAGKVPQAAAGGATRQKRRKAVTWAWYVDTAEDTPRLPPSALCETLSQCLESPATVIAGNRLTGHGWRALGLTNMKAATAIKASSSKPARNWFHGELSTDLDGSPVQRHECHGA